MIGKLLLTKQHTFVWRDKFSHRRKGLKDTILAKFEPRTVMISMSETVQQKGYPSLKTFQVLTSLGMGYVIGSDPESFFESLEVI